MLRFLDDILSYSRRCKWDNETLHSEYQESLEKSLEELRQNLIPVPPQNVVDSADGE